MILEANHYGTVCYKGMTLYLTRQVSPSGLSGSILALRYSAFAVNDYGFRLKCLASADPVREISRLDLHLDIWEFARILYQKLYPYFNSTGGAHKNGRENRNP